MDNPDEGEHVAWTDQIDMDIDQMLQGMDVNDQIPPNPDQDPIYYVNISKYQDNMYIQETATGMQYCSTIYTPHKNIVKLVCNDMKLRQLPRLPSILEYLECRYNQLLYINLPKNIKYLDCGKNKYPIVIKLSNKNRIYYIPPKFYNKNYLIIERQNDDIFQKSYFHGIYIVARNTYTKNFKDLPIKSIKQKCSKLRALYKHHVQQKEVSEKFYQEIR